MAGTDAPVNVADVGKGFTNLAHVPTQENIYEDVKRREKGKDREDGIKTEANPNQLKYMVQGNHTAPSNVVLKMGMVLLVLLVALSITTLIISAVLTHKQREDSAADASREAALQELNDKFDNLQTFVQAMRSIAQDTNEVAKEQKLKIDAASDEIGEMKVKLHEINELTQTQDNNFGLMLSQLQVISPVGVAVRLMDGHNSSSGRVEILHRGVWGTVCDDLWELEDATVICRMLGHGDAVAALPDAHFGEGSGTIVLDDVECTGTESSIWECSKMSWGHHDCWPDEAASVICAE